MGTGLLRALIIHLALQKTTSERERNLKYAIFCLSVAILLFAADQLAKHAPTNSSLLNSTINVRFDLFFDRPSGNSSPHNPAESSGYYIRFRLENEGNRSIFYPIHPGTRDLLGHIVHRTAAQAPWVALPTPNSANSPVRQSIDQNPGWIEMLPGGWLDGQFCDPSWPGDDHAYAFDLRQAANPAVIHFVSHPFHAHTE